MGVKTILAYISWCRQQNLKPSKADSIFAYQSYQDNISKKVEV